MSTNNYLPTQYQQYIHKSRYARWIWEENRRESWNETVTRYFNFFEEFLLENNNYKLDSNIRKELEESVMSLNIMPSMRCLMTAGEALKRENVSGYNCSYVAVDNPRSFDEILYILMNGTGVGFSVEQKAVDQLPIVSDDFHDSDTTIMVADSKLGWAKALKELIQLLYSGQIPKWDLSRVRPAGAPLKTFGGRASGPAPLDDLFRFCVSTFKKSAGRRLTTLECHDIVCKIAEIVVVGGVRRSALISLSDLSDDRMRVAKSGDWWKENVQRALANNSFIAKDKIDIGIFMKEWLSLYESHSGERGIFSRLASQRQAKKHGRRDSDHDFGTNPCSEIILRSREFCNLTEVVVRGTDNVATLKEKIRAATILGVIQSTLTNFKYLSKKWKENCEEERLLGVSLTGIMDNEYTNGKTGNLEDTLTQLREMAVKTAAEWSKKIGIPMSAAITCVKPSGCADIETKIKTSNGIMSISEIFDYMGYDIGEHNQGDWLEVTKSLSVYDENNDLKPITKLFVNGFSETYELTDENGNTYNFTGEHKVKVISKGWVRVDELSEDDEIVNF